MKKLTVLIAAIMLIVTAGTFAGCFNDTSYYTIETCFVSDAADVKHIGESWSDAKYEVKKIPLSVLTSEEYLTEAELDAQANSHGSYFLFPTSLAESVRIKKISFRFYACKQGCSDLPVWTTVAARIDDKGLAESYIDLIDPQEYLLDDITGGEYIDNGPVPYRKSIYYHDIEIECDLRFEGSEMFVPGDPMGQANAFLEISFGFKDQDQEMPRIGINNLKMDIEFIPRDKR